MIACHRTTPDERVRATLALHFHPEHGSHYWLRRQEALGWDVRDRVRPADDLWLLGATPTSDPRRFPLRDFIPAGLHGPLPDFVLGATAGARGGARGGAAPGRQRRAPLG